MHVVTSDVPLKMCSNDHLHNHNMFKPTSLLLQNVHCKVKNQSATGAVVLTACRLCSHYLN